MTTDANGLFRLTLPHGRVYVLTMYAPGFFPPERQFGFNVWLAADAPLVNYHSPFNRGGTVSGRVTNTSGAGVPNASFNIAPPLNFTISNANGDYAFLEQVPGDKGLGLQPPFPYVNANGSGFRAFPLPPNSFVTENWLVERRGRLTVHAQQEIGGQALPVGFVFFRLQGGSVDQVMVTGLNGQAVEDALDAGTYTITPLPEYLPPNTLISPSSRTVTITNETFASATFTVTPAQSLAVECQAGGVGFPCTVEIYDSDGNLVTSVELGGSNPATVITDLPDGSYEVVIIPSEPGWPETSSVVTLDGDTHAEVNYPFNPSNLQTISGYAYWDRCAPAGVRGNGTNCTETNVPSNNGLAVTLYNAAGSAVSATQTANGSGWDTGFYAFPDLPPGSYRVEISLPGGFVAQTATSVWRSLDGYASPEQVNFGYTRAENRFLSGYAFYDVNNNSSYDMGWDDPYAGAEITVSTPAGTLISSQTTASDGSFYVSPITSGEYRVVLTTPSLTLTRTAVVPASGGVPWVQFPLPPNDNRPRAIVFLDSNQNGQVDPTEQRLGGVNVELFSQQCGGIAAPIETKTTNPDGLALFDNLLTAQIGRPPAAAAAPGNPSGCVKIVSGTLPPEVAPANPNGVPMPRNSGVPVLLPVYPQGTLHVQVFWDADGDGQYDSGEPVLAGGTATAGGQTKSYSENGAVFGLAQGTYNLTVVPPAGYQVGASLPIPVVVGSGTALQRVPARVSGGIHGAVIGPAGALTGALVRLTNTATGQVFTTPAAAGCAGWCSDAFYQFHNLPGGQYRLSIPTPPPGHILASEPLVTYTAGQSLQQNLLLNPLGGISGLVYLDDNANGQRNAGEPGAGGYTVSLLNDSGLPVRTTTADANGGYLFDGLSAGVRYLVTLDLFVSQAASLSDSLTEAPGWFTPGMQPAQANLGILMGGSDHTYNTVSGRVTANGYGVAGIRVGYYHWVTGEGCSQANPAWINRETYSDINGDFKLLTNLLPGSEHTYCIAARQPAGYQQTAFPAVGSNFSYRTTGDVIVYHPGYWQRDVLLAPLQGGLAQARLTADAALRWSAFRDDNLNGQWDPDEPALPGVTLNGDATGLLAGLSEGFHSLSVASPAGYLPLHGSSVPVWMHGADATLPPLAFRFAGPLLVQAFSDEDGDGRQSAGEPGLPGVGVSLTGPAAAGASTGLDGRASLAGLPNGSYTLAVTSPPGYASLPNQAISLASGGAISLALRPLNQVSGAVYEDWDGDGRRGSGELAVINPLDVTASGLGSTRTALGMFRFWNASPGNYSVQSAWTAASPASLVLDNQGGGADRKSVV